MTGPTYTCPSGHPAGDGPAAGPLQHCEVCGAWVPAPRAALSREFLPPPRTAVPA